MKKPKKRSRDQNLRLRALIGEVLELCEETGQFPFGSRRMFNVGEWEIAFEGVYRFVNGNESFKATVEPTFSEIVAILGDELRTKRLHVHKWSLHS